MRAWWDFAADVAAHAPWVRPDPRPGAPADHAWWRGDSDQVSAFLYGYESLWLPASLLEPDQRGRLADALYEASRHFDVLLHVNKGPAGGSPEALAPPRGTPSTNPEVPERSRPGASSPPAACPTIPAIRPSTTRPPIVQGGRHRRRPPPSCCPKPRPAAPTSRKEQLLQPHWREAFWGSPLSAPQAAIKARYDPAGLFFLRHGVGSEDWSADGFTRL